MTYPIRIAGEQVALREFAPTDVDDVLSIIGDDKVTSWLSFDSRSRAEAVAMVDGAVARAQEEPRTEYYLGHCHVGWPGGMIFWLVVPGRDSFVSSASPSYKGHRYPVEVIAHAVWLYFRFPLSFREVEELMLERGVIVSYETIRRWSAKFGQAYADGLRRRRPRPGDKWHLDEVFVEINGEQKYLWRAVDQDGNVFDILLQSRRDKAAAGRFFRRLMKKTRTVPRVVVTDKIRSYGAAHREVMPSVEHRSHKGLNNRAENSHQPTRQRERAMKGFRSVGGAQRFLSAFSGISPHFRPHRHLMTASDHRAEMTVRFAIWDQITGAAGRPTTA